MAEAALNVIELLEMILSHLDMFDILITQRVCRHWQVTINASPILQGKLFFSADLAEERDINLGSYNTRCKSKNVKVVRVISKLTKLEDLKILHPSMSSVESPRVVPNPFLKPFQAPTEFHKEQFAFNVEKHELKALDCCFQPSWSHMFATQPCVRGLSIQVFAGKCLDSSAFEGALMIRDETGVRLGQLLQGVMTASGEAQRHALIIHTQHPWVEQESCSDECQELGSDAYDEQALKREGGHFVI